MTSSKPPIELATARARRGDLDPVACLRMQADDIAEGREPKPKLLLIITAEDIDAHSMRLGFRQAGGTPLLALGALEAAKAQLLAALGVSDVS